MTLSPHQLHLQHLAATQTSALQQMISANLNIGFDVHKYIDQAIRSGVQDISGYAYTLILKSPEFKAHFPGIFKTDGTLRISPQEYVQRKESFASTAAQYGFTLNNAQIGGLVTNNVDPQEFQTRAAGVQAVKSNPGLVSFINNQVQALNTYRAAHGQPLIRGLHGVVDAVNFFTGKADNELYAVYEGAVFRQQAKEAGINISTNKANRLAAQTPGVLGFDEAQQRFSKIAAQLREAGPEIRGFGLKPEDLLAIEFGGPNRISLAQRAEQALAQRQANLSTAVQQTATTVTRQNRPVMPSVAEPGL